MKETIHNRVMALVKKAREQGKKQDIKTVSSSSLHQVIKTKEQADRFMKSLKEAWSFFINKYWNPSDKAGFFVGTGNGSLQRADRMRFSAGLPFMEELPYIRLFLKFNEPSCV